MIHTCVDTWDTDNDRVSDYYYCCAALASPTTTAVSASTSTYGIVGLVELAYPCGSLMTFVSQIVSQIVSQFVSQIVSQIVSQFVSLFGLCFPVWNLFPTIQQ